MIVLTTLGAPPRRLLRRRRRRPRRARGGDPVPVPTVRATLVDADPLESEAAAASWLEGLRRDPEALHREAEAAARDLNGVLRAHRAAALDHHVREVSPEVATVTRVGYGAGEEVAYGRFAAALELPQERSKTSRRDTIRPQERLAAFLGGQEPLGPAAELALRAQRDVDAERPREAALQARIALEATLAQIPGDHRRRGELEAARGDLADAANAALQGDPPRELHEKVAAAVRSMLAALSR